MSNLSEDDLLAGDEEFDYGSYDITNEKEEDLLQDEDYQSQSDEHEEDKKGLSENDEQDDVLHLDAEEDFQDDDDKLLYDEENQSKTRKNTKFVNERQVQNAAMVNNEMDRTPVAKLAGPKSGVTAGNSDKNFITRNDSRWRGNNRRGGFQTRHNNNKMRGRNGTVLINPRYEGVVHINENNSRLAWDNTQYTPPNNQSFVPPWTVGNAPVRSYQQSQPNPVLNLVSNLVRNSQSLLPQPQVQRQLGFFHSNRQEKMVFEPPPPQYPKPLFTYQNRQNFSPWTNNSQVTNSTFTPSQNFHKPTIYQQPTVTQPYQSYQNYNYNISGNNQNNLNTINQQNYGQQQNVNQWYQNKNTSYNVSQVRRNNFDGANYRNAVGNPSVNYNSNNWTNTSQNNSPMKYENRNLKPIVTRSNTQVLNANQQSNVNAIENRSGGFVNNRRPLAKTANIGIELPEKKQKIEEPKAAEKSGETKNEPARTNKIQDEEDDEEMRQYKLKIEEQKKEREKLLQIKEERRKQMLLQRQQKNKDQLLVDPPKPLMSTPVQKPLFSQNSANAALKQTSSVPPKQTSFVPPKQTSFVPPKQTPFVPVKQASSVALKQTSPSDDVPRDEFPNLTFKVSNSVQQVKSADTNNTGLGGSSFSSFMANRVVTVKSTNTQISKTAEATVMPSPPSSPPQQEVASFLTNRKVLKKDNVLPNTGLVLIKNLAATTTQNKLVALTRGIGEIQKLHLDKQERQATILFKSVASAHAFYRKYQRRILDLSVIEVELEPLV